MSGNLYLIGFMGVGKSAVGRMLQAKYGCRHLEMDDEIEREAGKTISEIFAQEGEESFRQMETNTLRRLSGRSLLVVSCGGGTPMRPENVALMKESGRVVYLTASAQTIFERVRHSHKRPILEGNMNLDFIRTLMDQRQAAYEAAADMSFHVDGKSLEEICKALHPILEPSVGSGKNAL